MANKINAPEINRIWQLYQAGISIKSTIGLYDTASRNERFYAGDQWDGVDAPGLPKPVINFIKRACQQKVANVSGSPIKVKFISADFPSKAVTPQDIQQNMQNNVQKINAIKTLKQDPTAQVDRGDSLASEADADILSAMFEMDWERNKMDYVNQCGLLDACISGDYILYNYFDAGAETGQEVKGEIQVERVDNVNYYPTNANEPDPQKQPSIIIARRELISDVKTQAKKYKVSSDDIEKITNDWDFQWQSGDMSKRENYDPDANKCITLLYLWKDVETGHIMAQKSTRTAPIRPAWDTELKRYPICMMNWELRKNSAFGRAEITGLIPNQVATNRVYAMAALSIMQTAFPKVIYNQAVVKEWTNDLTDAIATNGDVQNAAKYMVPASMASDAFTFPEKVMRTTMELIGANDAEMGNTNPTNSSAFLLARQQAEVPIQTVLNRFYNMIREFARNWLDMTMAYAKASRWVNMQHMDGNTFIEAFQPENFKDKLWSVDIKIGTASSWNYGVVVDQLGKCLQSGQIDFKTYLKLMPEEYFPNKDEILQDIEQQQSSQQPKEKPPNLSINLKDLPVNGQIQGAAQANIQLTPQDYQQQMQPQEQQQGQPDAQQIQQLM